MYFFSHPPICIAYFPSSYNEEQHDVYRPKKPRQTNSNCHLTPRGIFNIPTKTALPNQASNGKAICPASVDKSYISKGVGPVSGPVSQQVKIPTKRIGRLSSINTLINLVMTALVDVTGMLACLRCSQETYSAKWVGDPPASGTHC